MLTLCNEEQLGQKIEWKEIYPWEFCHTTQENNFCYEPPNDCRWFLLAVSMVGLFIICCEKSKIYSCVFIILLYLFKHIQSK